MIGCLELGIIFAESLMQRRELGQLLQIREGVQGLLNCNRVPRHPSYLCAQVIYYRFSVKLLLFKRCPSTSELDVS